MNILLVRNILSTIFIIGAIVGMVIYFKYDQTTGTIVILASMCFKFTETCLRMMNKKDDE
jgi:uncharacterized membrane protein